MSPTDKPRSDSKLKTLPEDRQAEIADFAHAHSLADTVVWLSGNGIQTSTSALSTFLAWYRLTQQMARNDLIVKELLTDLSQKSPDINRDRIYEIGHVFFAALAIEKQDPKAWYLARQIALQKDQVDLALRRYQDQIQERKEAIQRELNAAKSSGGLSPETIEKIEHELNLF